MVHPRQLFVCLPLLASIALWARLEMPPASIDLNAYLPYAPIVLRAEILAVSAPPRPFERYVATARLRVTRWYRGQTEHTLALRFPTGGLRTFGHDCVAFPPGTHWLILAWERDGALELIADCYGALEVAPQIGAIHTDPITQLEADFSAGLSATDPRHRILSLQRLANLQLPASRPALHEVIARGGTDEAIWAAYAALRTGDVTVIPTVHAMLQKETPYGLGNLPSRALEQIHDPAAIPALIQIAYSPAKWGKTSALIALGNFPEASAALPAITANLNSEDEFIRRAARRAMARLTNTPIPAALQ